MSATRSHLAARIARLLAFNRASRDPAREPRNRLPMLPVVQRWQAERLAASFADLLRDPSTAPAARFFLSDLYGDHDVSGRDRGIERVMPLMQRVLSPKMLEIAADAIELAVLSHAFDLRMAQALSEDGAGGAIDAERYARAYRDVGRPRLRARQLMLTEALGHGLADVVGTRHVAQMLRLARIPARAAGLGDLQNFLERGFEAFGVLPEPRAFVDTIIGRERDTMQRLFAADPQPFPPPPATR